MKHRNQSLDVLQKKLDDSEWKFDYDFGKYMYTLVHVAHEWGMKPSQLNICDPDEDVALMSAYIFTKGGMASWEQHLREVEVEKNKRKSKPGSKRKRR